MRVATSTITVGSDILRCVLLPGAGSVSADDASPQPSGAEVTGQIMLMQGTYLYSAVGQQAIRQSTSALGKLTRLKASLLYRLCRLYRLCLRRNLCSWIRSRPSPMCAGGFAWYPCDFLASDSEQ